MPVIIDATVALSWLFEDETSDYADRVLDAVASDGAVVPAIWLLEVANGLLSGERRGRLSAAEVDEARDLLSALPLRIDAACATAPPAHGLALARAHGLTSYDAAYVEVAQRLGLPLATEDQAMLRAAQALALPCFA